jgi:hypothetical protein
MRPKSSFFILFLIFGELIPIADFGLLLVVQTREIGFPAGTEVDVPTPEASHQGAGLLVIMSTEFAVFT